MRHFVYDDNGEEVQLCSENQHRRWLNRHGKWWDIPTGDWRVTAQTGMGGPRVQVNGKTVKVTKVEEVVA